LDIQNVRVCVRISSVKKKGYLITFLKKGKQTEMLNVIKSLADSNVEFSHILNVKVANQTSSLVGTKLRQFIHKSLNGVNNNVVNFGGIGVVIVWNSVKSQTSAYYISNSMYSDRITNDYTRNVLNEIVNAFNQTGTYDWTRMGLSYLITKPLLRNYPIGGETLKPNLNDELTKLKK